MRLALQLVFCFGLAAALANPANSWPPETIRTSGASLDVSFEGAAADLQRASFIQWAASAGAVVSAFFGRFPVETVRIEIIFDEGRRGVLRGMTSNSADGAVTRVHAGERVTQDELDHDWVLIHEFIHLGFPSISSNRHWLEEGLATYAEPVAQAQAGRLTAEQVWTGFVRNMPQGQPPAGGEGLDQARGDARTYWGGALFCLLADVQIRERTHNRKSLRDALRGILASGGNIEQEWPVERALKVGGQATGTHVLSKLYSQMKDKPPRGRLEDLWKQLGVIPQGESVTFDNQAPLSAIRRAITQPRR